MGNQPATMTITLNVPDDFTGRVLVYLDKGKVKSQCRLRNNEIVSTVEGFSELALAIFTATPDVGDEWLFVTLRQEISPTAVRLTNMTA